MGEKTSSRVKPTIIIAAIILVALIGGAYYMTLPLGPTTTLTTQLTTKKAEPKVIRFGLESAITSIDVHMSVGGATSVYRGIYEPLLMLTKDPQTDKLVIKPCLAESWTQVNATCYEFKIRKGVKFHNGMTMTAADVKWSLERALGGHGFEKALARQEIDPLKRFQVIDDYTIRIGTDQPYGPFLIRLQHPAAGVIPKAFAETLKNQDDFGKYCYGTGPFKLVDFVPGEKVVLEKFADYWGAPAKVDRVEFIVLKDELTRLTALETGEIDMCFKVSPTYVNRLKGKGFNVVSAPNSRLLYLNLNVRKAPFKDLRCRQALAYAIDYDKIVKEIFLGMVEPAYGSISVHQSFPFAVPEPPYKYDPEKAKKLLAEAGYPNGVDVTFWGSSGRYTNMKEVQEAIAAYLSAVGFRVKFQMFEWGSYVSIVNAQVGEVWNGIRETVEYDIAFLGWALSTPDVSYNSGYQTTKQSFNWATWSNDRVDQLYMQGVTTTSPEERAKIYKEIQDILAKELPFVWLYTEPWLNALKPGVTGMIFMPMESYYYFDIDKK